MAENFSHLYSVFVGNLHEDVTEDDLLQLFMGSGEVIDYVLIQGKERNKSNFGFVRYAKQEEAVKSIKDLNGWSFKSQRIIVDIASNSGQKLSFAQSARSDDMTRTSLKEPPPSLWSTSSHDSILNYNRVKEACSWVTDEFFATTHGGICNTEHIINDLDKKDKASLLPIPVMKPTGTTSYKMVMKTLNDWENCLTLPPDQSVSSSVQEYYNIILEEIQQFLKPLSALNGSPVCQLEAKSPVSSDTTVSDKTKTPVSDMTKTSVSEITKTPVSEITKTLVRGINNTPVSVMTKTTVSDITKIPVIDMTNTSVSEITKTPVNDMTKTPVNDMTKTPVSDFNNTPVSVMTKTPISEINSTHVSDMTKTTVSDMTKTLVSDITKIPVIDMTNTSVSEMTKTPLSNMTKTTVSDMTKTLVSDMTKTPVIDMTNTSVSEITKTLVNDMTPISVMTKTTVSDITKTPVSEITKTPVSDINNTTVSDITKKPENDMTQTLVSDMIKTLVNDITKTTVSDMTKTPVSDMTKSSECLSLEEQSQFIRSTADSKISQSESCAYVKMLMRQRFLLATNSVNSSRLTASPYTNSPAQFPSPVLFSPSQLPTSLQLKKSPDHYSNITSTLPSYQSLLNLGCESQDNLRRPADITNDGKTSSSKPRDLRFGTLVKLRCPTLVTNDGKTLCSPSKDLAMRPTAVNIHFARKQDDSVWVCDKQELCTNTDQLAEIYFQANCFQ